MKELESTEKSAENFRNFVSIFDILEKNPKKIGKIRGKFTFQIFVTLVRQISNNYHCKLRILEKLLPLTFFKKLTVL